MFRIKHVLSAIFIAIGFLFFSVSAASAFLCDATYPSHVVANEPFQVRVELPNPTDLNANSLDICPVDPISLNPADADPQGKLCYRFSVCKTGVAGPGGCANFPQASWFTPWDNTTAGAKPNNMTYSGDKKFLILDWNYDMSITLKLEKNDRRTNLTSWRTPACSQEWKIDVSSGPAYCTDGVFETAKGSDGKIAFNFNGNSVHRFFRGDYWIFIRTPGGGGSIAYSQYVTALQDEQGRLKDVVSDSLTTTRTINSIQPGQWEIVIQDAAGKDIYQGCSSTFSVDADNNPGPVDQLENGSSPFILCNQAAPEDKEKCMACITGDPASREDNITDPDNQGLWTAFGCVKTSKEGIVTSFVKIGLGLAGGFVLLSILWGSFLLTTSSGEPKRVQEGQEMISSAVMGLIFVIMSIIILKFIGVSILQIPGFV